MRSELDFFQVLDEFYTYSYSIYRNSLWELGVFISFMILYFTVMHYKKSNAIKKYRDDIALVVGGWGSRGKSGTERLKAALFHGMDLEVSSKTTGCEAMIVHSIPRGKMKEIFLFRPYDKATIWEQVHVLQISSALEADVFLWECMALTPDYVRTLQKQWVKDDLSTITNAHPDHEDVQGPAGYNVAQVMCEFVPEEGHLITTEDQMRPLLSNASALNQTGFESVSFIDSGLITPDILERFPYAEHPFNIALVSKLANKVGVDTDRAYKSMADFIVPDLGVLRQYPPANVEGRKLQFINGMSANERFAAIGNWQRMGMKDATLDHEPETWLSVVVNNRADRVPRSQVFARICVEDLSLDRIYLIGTNLNGFMSYLNNFWDEFSANFSIWKNLENNEASEEDIVAIANQLHLYHSEEQFLNRINSCLAALNLSPLQKAEGLEEHLKEVSEEDKNLLLSEYEAFQVLSNLKHQVKNKDHSIKENLKTDLDKLFKRKIVILQDPFAKANTITQTITNTTPKGLLNRIMGVQNIKGTGLGFAYSWEDWGYCHEACEGILSLNPDSIAAGMAYLSGRKDFNVQSRELVTQLIQWVEVAESENLEPFKESIQALKEVLKSSQEQDSSSKKEENARPAWQNKIIEIIEQILDPGDGIKRRRKSDKIYVDLCKERISHERAEQELKAIVNRQKGGWFKKDWNL